MFRTQFTVGIHRLIHTPYDEIVCRPKSVGRSLGLGSGWYFDVPMPLLHYIRIVGSVRFDMPFSLFECMEKLFAETTDNRAA